MSKRTPEENAELKRVQEAFAQICTTIGPTGLPPSFADAYRQTHKDYKGKNSKQLACEFLGPQDSNVRKEIRRRQAENKDILRDEYKATAADVIRRLTAIAFADPREFVGLRQGPCKSCWAGSEKQVVPDPKCEKCLGEGRVSPYLNDTDQVSDSAAALYAGLKITREGTEVKFHSQEKALELLGRNLGMFVEKVEIMGERDTIKTLVQSFAKRMSKEEFAAWVVEAEESLGFEL